MSEPFDFAVYDSLGVLRLVIEAKPRRGIDEYWARDLRANIAERVGSKLPPIVIATPVSIYAWEAGEDLEDLASYSALFEETLKPYYVQAGLHQDDFVDPVVFETIVAHWLEDVAAGVATAPGPIDALLAPLRGGRIVREAA